MGIFSKFFSLKKQDEKPPKVDIEAIVSSIRQAEQSNEIPLGRKIVSFEYGELQVRFDRDITHNGRICIFEGEEKLFSFTVFAKEGEYEILKEAFESAFNFLQSDRSIKNLPDNKVLKGFYHHH